MFTYEIPSKYLSIPVDKFHSLDVKLRGVYVIKNKYGDCIYVGQSKYLRNRLRNHVQSSPFSAHIDSADIYNIPDGFEREICETIFINSMKPRYNRAKVFVPFGAEQARLSDELTALEDDRDSYLAELEELRDVPDDYEDTYDYYTDEDECTSFLLGEVLINSARIPEIETEIRRLSGEIRERYKLFY